MGMYTGLRVVAKIKPEYKGWVDYSHNLVLVKLFSHALVASASGHEVALENIKDDILKLKQANGIDG